MSIRSEEAKLPAASKVITGQDLKDAYFAVSACFGRNAQIVRHNPLHQSHLNSLIKEILQNYDVTSAQAMLATRLRATSLHRVAGASSCGLRRSAAGQ